MFAVVQLRHFGHHQTMNVEHADVPISEIATAIAEPARTRMLYSLLDGHSRTSTELAIVAEVSPSTASAHLARLKEQHLVKVLAQGKHRYYSLDGTHVAAALEALSVLAGRTGNRFVPNTPIRLRTARTCYDHMAGTLAVALHDRFLQRDWIASNADDDGTYDLTKEGTRAFADFGVNIAEARTSRRRFAYACLDWSERRPHVAGAVGAALLQAALKRKWVVQDLDGRALNVTAVGRRNLRTRFDVEA
jgi:DNA-binding transcriptional ArsR family regulator/uncharacterized protein YjhX (UPF0386 family)